MPREEWQLEPLEGRLLLSADVGPVSCAAVVPGAASELLSPAAEVVFFAPTSSGEEVVGASHTALDPVEPVLGPEVIAEAVDLPLSTRPDSEAGTVVDPPGASSPSRVAETAERVTAATPGLTDPKSSTVSGQEEQSGSGPAGDDDVQSTAAQLTETLRAGNAPPESTLALATDTEITADAAGTSVRRHVALHGITNTGEIRGQIFEDLDGNGSREGDETGLNGWKVALINRTTNEVIATATTRSVDSNHDGKIDPATEQGLYEFTGLAAGEYEVREFNQSGYVSSLPGGLAYVQTNAFPWTENNPAHLVVGDLNGDLAPDLVVMSFASDGRHTVYLILNQGEDRYSTPAPVWAAAANASWNPWYDLGIADVDRDGDLDLLIADGRNKNLVVLLNNGRAAFATPRSYPMLLETESLAVADLNGDQYPDVVVGRANQEQLALVFNRGDGTFAAPVSLSLNASPAVGEFTTALTTGDLNYDGLQDIVVGLVDWNSTPKKAEVRVYLNNGGGTFTRGVSIDLAGDYAQVLATGDLDGDGFADVVVSRDWTETWVLWNDGRGGLTKTKIADTNPYAVAIADMDRDGKPDLLCGGSYAWTILRNCGQRTFTERPGNERIAQTGYTTICPADLDRDGWLDVVAVNTYYPNEDVRLYRNAASWRVTLAAAQVRQDLNFGTFRPSTVQGCITNDLDGDGLADAGEPGLAGWTIYRDLDGNGQLTRTTTTFTAPDVPVRQELGTAPSLVTTSSLQVDGLLGIVQDLDVRLNIRFSPETGYRYYSANLSGSLITPSGVQISLFFDSWQDTDGVGGMELIGTVFDDDATVAIGSGNAPFTGRFRPSSPLSQVNGDNPNGTWTLRLYYSSPYARTQPGVIEDWSITITTTEPNQTTGPDGAYRFVNLPAGSEQVSVAVPAGWEPTSPSGAWRALLLSGGQTVSADFLVRQPSTGPPGELALTLVRTPSTVDAKGQISSLPSSASWVHEWEAFYVEIWASTPGADDRAILAARASLLYATAYTTATEIQYGPAFTLDRTGAINDATGRVENLGARTELTNVGAQGYVLVARVKFESKSTDQVPVDKTTRFIGPYSLGLALADAQLRLAGSNLATATAAPAPSTGVWAIPYDGNDSQVIDQADFPWFAEAFLHRPADGDPPFAWWGDFDKSGLDDFGDFSYFVANLGLARPATNVVLPPGFPFSWNGPSLTAQLRDDTAPLATATADGITRDPTVVGRLTRTPDLVRFTVRLDGAASGSPVNALPYLQPDGTFTFDQAALAQLYGRALADGAYVLRFEAENSLGNRSTVMVPIVLDTTAPATPAAPLLVESSDTGLSHNDHLTQRTRISIRVTADPASLARLFVDGLEVAHQVVSDGTVDFDLGGLAVGDHLVTTRVDDAAGNSSPASAPLLLTVDTTGPIVVAQLAHDTGLSAYDRLTYDPIVTGVIGNRGTAFRFEARLNPWVGYRDLTSLVAADGTFTLSRGVLEQLNGGPLADGDYTLAFRATDGAGNGSGPASVWFRLDTTAPASPTFALADLSDTGSPGDNRTCLSSVTLTGRATPGTTIRLNGTELTATTDAAGEFVLTAVPLKVGANAITLLAIDAAGNQALTTRTITGETAAAVAFADPDLAAAVRQQLGLASDHALDEADLFQLRELSVDNWNITSLKGLEKARNLEVLSLVPRDFNSPSPLADLTAIVGLPNLTQVTLMGAGLTSASLTTLAQVSSVRFLDLAYNNIQNASVLGGLPNLQTLHLYANPVTDLSGLAGRPIDLDLAPKDLAKATTVAQLAAALYKLPLKIYEYVLNTFEYQPYNGLMKSPQAVLETKAGNDWDLARLLVDLLAECGVTARYARGTARPSMADVRNWLGVTDDTAAQRLLWSAAGSEATVPSYPFKHTWVEAQLTLPGGQSTWVPLDPSWKLKEYQPGVANLGTLVPFDEAGYLSEVRAETAADYYENQVAAYLAANLPDQSLADVPYRGVIKPQRVTTAPTALPYATQDVVRYDHLAAIASWTHRVQLTLRYGATVLFQRTLALPDVSLEALTVTYTAAGTGQVRPELRVGGTVVVTGSAISTSASVDLTIDHLDPLSTQVNRSRTYSRLAGTVIAIGLDANQISSAMLLRLQAQVTEGAIAALNGDPSAAQAQVGDFLALGVLKYLDEVNHGEDLVCSLMGATAVRSYFGAGIASGETQFFGNSSLQYPYVPKSVMLDVAGHVQSRIIAVRGYTGSADPAEVVRQKVIDLESSAREHTIWEELANTPSMSTIKSLQLANELGIPILKINAANAATLLPQLTLPASDQAAIQTAINGGATVTVPRDLTPYLDWTGVGYILEYPDQRRFKLSGGIDATNLDPDAEDGGMPAKKEAELAKTILQYLDQVFAGDPVNLANGVLTVDGIDVQIPGIGLPLAFARHYDTQSTLDVGLGSGWIHNYADRLAFGPGGQVTWQDFRGYSLTFTADGSGGYLSPIGTGGTLSHTATGYTYREVDGQTREFDNTGRLTRVADRNGNALVLAYNASGLLASVTDAAHPGRRLTFTFDAARRLTSVSDFTGRTWNYAYTDGRLARVTGPAATYTIEYSYYTDTARQGLLASVKDPSGAVTSYAYYANRRVMRVTDGEGFSQWFSYNLFNHQTDLIDEAGATTQYRYNDAGNLTLTRYPDGSREAYVWSNGHRTQAIDPYGQVTRYTYDARGNVIRTVDRAGTITETTYHPTFNFATQVTVAGQTTRYAYDARGNLTSITDPLGNVTTMTYDAQGQLLTRTAPKGNLTPTQSDYTTSYTYDDNGRVLSERTDLPSLRTFTYDLRGNVLTATDANNHTTAYEYNLLDQLVRTTDALGHITTYTYTPAGQQAVVTDPLNATVRFSYDRRGRLLETRDANGNLTQFTYDAAGNAVTESDALGRMTSFAFNHRGRCTTTLFADGTSELCLYGGDNRMTAAVDARGGRTNYAYDRAGRLIQTTNPLNLKTTWTYNAAGDLQSLTDTGGATTRYAYDAAHRVVQVTDALGHVTATAYDANGNIASLTDALGHVTRYAYDVLDRQIRITDALGNVYTKAYDAVGNLIATTDPRGNTTRRTYDAANRLLTITAATGDTIVNAYDAVGRLTQVTDRGGGITRYAFDLAGRLIAVTDPLGGITRTRFDPVGNALSVTDALGRTSRFTYNLRNQAIRITDPLGNVTWKFYDANGNTIAILDPLGNLTQFTFDALNRVIRVIDPLGYATLTTYDPAGNIATIQDPLGSTVRYSYDALGQRTAITDALGQTTTFAYDAVGNRTEVTDPLGHRTQYGYDALNRQTTVTDALAGVTTTTYDPAGNVASVTDPLGRVTRYDYDALNRVIRVTNALNFVNTIAYNRASQIASVTDPLGRKTQYAYDASGRLTVQTDALGHTTTYAYDAVGNLTSITNELGRTTRFTYDALNREISAQDPLGQSRTTTYDAAGQVVAITDARGFTTTYTYDAAGRQVTCTDPLGHTTRSQYDPAGRLVALTDPLGQTTRFAYDALGRQVGITDPLGQTTLTSYDAAGNVTAITDATGATTQFTYDALNRRVTCTDPLGNSQSSSYDAVGNVVAVTNALGRTSRATYDALNRQIALTDALGNTIESEYDAVGNLVAVTDALGHTTEFTYDALNRNTAVTDALGKVTLYAYDAAGNLVSITDALNHQTRFSYTALNRVERVTDALGHTTRSEYDAAGNLVRYTDPLGNTETYTYDALNRRISLTNRLGETSTTTYDAAGRVVAATDFLGRTTRYVVDPLGQNVITIDPLGHAATQQYDACGRATEFTDPLGRRTVSTYDAAGRLVKVTDALGQPTTYTYDAAGNRTTTTNALGQTTRIGYDALNRPVSVTDALGQTSTKTYDSVGNVTAVTDALGRTTRYAYDAVNRLTTVTDPLNFKATSTYDAVGNLLTVTDALGRVTRYAYDEVNRQTAVTDALGGIWRTTYDAGGNAVTTTDPQGHVTRYAYDACGRLIRVTDPLGAITTTSYDAGGNVVSVTDPLGHTTQTTYDAANRVIRVTNALGDSYTTSYDAVGNVIARTDPLGRTTRFYHDPLDRTTAWIDALGGSHLTRYDAVGNITAAQDALGTVTRFTYDALGRQTATIDALGGTTTIEYDAVGNVVAGTDALGHTTRFVYDALNRRTQITDALGNVTRTTYDAVGNVVTTTDAAGHVTRYAYDALNRQIETTTPLGAKTSVAYDAEGNVLRITDALGAHTDYAYDAMNRQVSITDPLGNTSRLTYDLAGNTRTLTDALGNQTTYTYDALNRIVTITDPLGETQTRTYDRAGNLVATTNRDGDRRRYTFDALNRRIREEWLDAAGTVTRTLTYQFDAQSRLVAATDPDAGYQCTYDALGRQTRVNETSSTGGATLTVTLDYDAVGNVVTATEWINGTASSVRQYRYDALNRLVRVTLNGTDLTPARVDLGYDAVGQIATISRYQTLTASDTPVVSTYTYDAANRLLALVHARGTQTLSQYQLTRDANGRVLTTVTVDGLTRFTYDAAGQLTSVDYAGQPDQVFTYDAGGNRSSGGLVYGPDNRLLHDGTYAYEYDAEGNRTRRTSSSGSTEYQWDDRNRLTRVITRNSAGQVTQAVTYTYDLLDRRIATSVDADGAGPGLPVTTRFVWLGSNLASEVNAAGQVQHRYLHGLLPDQLFADLDAQGNLLWILPDDLGSVVDLAKPDGTLVQHRQYDSYGNLLAQTNPTLRSRFGYTGRDFDPETGLYYYRARYYDPRVGRFISQDPFAFAAGDLNLYRYVGNNPVNAVDPTGTIGIPLTGLLEIGAATGSAGAFGLVPADIAARLESAGSQAPLDVLLAQLLGDLPEDLTLLGAGFTTDAATGVSVPAFANAFGRFSLATSRPAVTPTFGYIRPGSLRADEASVEPTTGLAASDIQSLNTSLKPRLDLQFMYAQTSTLDSGSTISLPSNAQPQLPITPSGMPASNLPVALVISALQNSLANGQNDNGKRIGPGGTGDGISIGGLTPLDAKYDKVRRLTDLLRSNDLLTPRLEKLIRQVVDKYVYEGRAAGQKESQRLMRKYDQKLQMIREHEQMMEQFRQRNLEANRNARTVEFVLNHVIQPIADVRRAADRLGEHILSSAQAVGELSTMVYNEAYGGILRKTAEDLGSRLERCGEAARLIYEEGLDGDIKYTVETMAVGLNEIGRLMSNFYAEGFDGRIKGTVDRMQLGRNLEAVSKAARVLFDRYTGGAEEWTEGGMQDFVQRGDVGALLKATLASLNTKQNIGATFTVVTAPIGAGSIGKALVQPVAWSVRLNETAKGIETLGLLTKNINHVNDVGRILVTDRSLIQVSKAVQTKKLAEAGKQFKQVTVAEAKQYALHPAEFEALQLKAAEDNAILVARTSEKTGRVAKMDQLLQSKSLKIETKQADFHLKTDLDGFAREPSPQWKNGELVPNPTRANDAFVKEAQKHGYTLQPDPDDPTKALWVSPRGNLVVGDVDMAFQGSLDGLFRGGVQYTEAEQAAFARQINRIVGVDTVNHGAHLDWGLRHVPGLQLPAGTMVFTPTGAYVASTSEELAKIMTYFGQDYRVYYPGSLAPTLALKTGLTRGDQLIDESLSQEYP